MSDQTLNTRIKICSDTAANWSTNNPVLLEGEGGFDKTNYRMKVGDGNLAWNSLPYLKSAVTLNGYSALDASFYAPVVSGTSGYLLKSNGANSAPTWIETIALTNIAPSATANQVLTTIYDSTEAAYYVGWKTFSGGGGGASITLNGTSTDDALFYAPIVSGTSGQFLKSSGANTAPVWQTLATVATSGAYTDLSGTPTLATVATTGAYSDLSGTPTIPTVNNATLTIQKNGTTVNTFTANASTAVTANITVPTNNNELTNGAGYITGITSAMIATALGLTTTQLSYLVQLSKNINSCTGSLVKLNSGVTMTADIYDTF